MLPNAASALFDVIMHVIVYIQENYKIVHLLLILSLKKNTKHNMPNTSSGLPRAGVPVRRIALTAFCTIGNKILLRVAFLDFI